MKEDKTFLLNELDIANQYIHIASIRVILKNILQTIMKKYQDYLILSEGKYQFYKLINGIDLSLHELNYLLFSLYHWKRNFKVIELWLKNRGRGRIEVKNKCSPLHLCEMANDVPIINLSRMLQLLLSEKTVYDILCYKTFPMKMKDFYLTIKVQEEL